MTTSPWLHARPAAAICPHCNAPALRRSHTHSRFEVRRKEISGKRPFRCHVCSWRGWIDETALRFPSSAQKPLPPEIVGKDVPIPDLQLDEDAPSKDRSSPSPPATGKQTASGQSEANRQSKKDVTAADEVGRPSPENAPAESTHTGSRNGSRNSSRNASRNGSRQERDGQLQAENRSSERNGAEDAFTLHPPEFEARSGAPVSDSVGTRFHHHSRNKRWPCPKCGEYALYRSRARTFAEKLRNKLTTSRPFRCHRCAWRGWTKR